LSTGEIPQKRMARMVKSTM